MTRTTLFPTAAANSPAGRTVRSVGYQRGVLVVRYTDGTQQAFSEPIPAPYGLRHRPTGTANPLMPALSLYVPETTTHVDVYARPSQFSKPAFLKRGTVPTAASRALLGPVDKNDLLIEIELEASENPPGTRYLAEALVLDEDGGVVTRSDRSAETWHNRAPYQTGKGGVSGPVGAPLTVDLNKLFADDDTADGLDALVYALAPGAPAWATLAGSTVTVNTTAARAGTVGVVATDRLGLTAAADLDVTVTATVLPVVTALAIAGTTLTATFASAAPAGCSLVVDRAPALSVGRGTYAPAWQTVAVATGALTVDVALSAVDDAGAGFRARLVSPGDGRKGGYSPETYLNRAPAAGKPSAAEIVVEVGSIDSRFDARAIAYDPDGRSCAYALVGAPSWVTLDGSGRLAQLVVWTKQVRARTLFDLTATDERGASVTVACAVTVPTDAPLRAPYGLVLTP